jgi:hypothetical protein
MRRTVNSPSWQGSPPTTVYGLKDVAEILQMPKSKVKNWTIGRPLRLAPSIKGFGGIGSRNLYSYTDVLRFAVVKHLADSGFAPEFVEQAVMTMARHRWAMIPPVSAYRIFNFILARRLGETRVECFQASSGSKSEKVESGSRVFPSKLPAVVSAFLEAPPALLYSSMPYAPPNLEEWAKREGIVSYHVFRVSLLVEQVEERIKKLSRRGRH